ncbi:chorismate mutase [Streptomyces sp. NPDC026672]|uniref:chorismate mutase n=1 Tax=unclassified Streptomyces TaxID=2593676 RepID=UPI0033E47A5D
MDAREDSDALRRREERLAEISARIVGLVHEFIDEERILAAAREAAGLPRTDLSRENEMVRYYAGQLTSGGANLALTLLLMRRGRA